MKPIEAQGVAEFRYNESCLHSAFAFMHLDIIFSGEGKKREMIKSNNVGFMTLKIGKSYTYCCLIIVELVEGNLKGGELGNLCDLYRYCASICQC
jgi:hypothetical protein